MSLKEIGNKIFDKEVKLSREEIELGIADDIIALQKQAQKNYNLAEREMTKAKNIIHGSIDDELEEARAAMELQLKKIKTFKARLKELGVPMPKEYTSIEGKATRLAKYVKEDISKLNKIKSALK